MSISHQIEALAEDIEASYGRRKAAVSDIAKETHQALGNFKRERKKMASDLKHSLASNSSRRASRVQKMLADFSSDRQEMATALNATLARETSERIDNTHHLLSHFIREHKKMTRSLRRELSSFQSDLVKAV